MPIITAKYNSNCANPECMEPLRKGSEIYYDNTFRKAFCVPCAPEEQGDLPINGPERERAEELAQSLGFIPYEPGPD